MRPRFRVSLKVESSSPYGLGRPSGPISSPRSQVAGGGGDFGDVGEAGPEFSAGAGAFSESAESEFAGFPHDVSTADDKMYVSGSAE